MRQASEPGSFYIKGNAIQLLCMSESSVFSWKHWWPRKVRLGYSPVAERWTSTFRLPGSSSRTGKRKENGHYSLRMAIYRTNIKDRKTKCPAHVCWYPSPSTCNGTSTTVTAAWLLWTLACPYLILTYRLKWSTVNCKSLRYMLKGFVKNRILSRFFQLHSLGVFRSVTSFNTEKML